MSSNLIKQLFKEWDKDGSGAITKEEFIQAMCKDASKLTGEQKAKLIETVEKFDTSGDGKITVDEFPGLLFAVFDADGSGSLKKLEIRKGFYRFGQYFMGDSFYELAQQYDTDGNGEFSVEEFYKMLGMPYTSKVVGVTTRRM